MVDLKIGALIVVAVAIIFGVVLIQESIAPTVNQYSNTVSVVNQSVTFTAGTRSMELSGQRGVGTPIVINASDGKLATGSNFTFTEGLGSEGLLSTFLTAAGNSVYNNTIVNVSYTYEPDGYMHASADRSVFGLIIIVSALALVAFVLFGIKIKEVFSL